MSKKNNNVISIEKFNKIEGLYYNRANDFYINLDKETMLDVYSIITKKHKRKKKISLRFLDWFVTKYSSKYNVCYKNNEDDDDFNVHISYKAQLKSYKKKYFDPFRRRKKFYYYYDKNNLSKRILTTIGQLNFFRWAFANNVIHYVEHNHKTIFKAMNKSNKEDKKRKLQKKKQKQKHTTKKHKTKTNKTVTVDDNKVNIFAKKNISDDEVKIILTFD